MASELKHALRMLDRLRSSRYIPTASSRRFVDNCCEALIVRAERLVEVIFDLVEWLPGNAKAHSGHLNIYYENENCPSIYRLIITGRQSELSALSRQTNGQLMTSVLDVFRHSDLTSTRKIVEAFMKLKAGDYVYETEKNDKSPG